jgi:hypothetical protein
MEYYSAIKKNEWMKLEIIILSEITQAQKDKGQMFSSYVELKDKCTHKYTYNLICIYVYKISVSHDYINVSL